MFEAGEVDFIVATDAIGMGLNLNIDNVSFASLEKYDGKIVMIIFDLLINLGMSVSGFLLILVVFNNVPQAQAYDSYKYPVGFLFGLTSNVSIPIVLKWFSQQITAKLSEVGKK